MVLVQQAVFSVCNPGTRGKQTLSGIACCSNFNIYQVYQGKACGGVQGVRETVESQSHYRTQVPEISSKTDSAKCDKPMHSRSSHGLDGLRREVYAAGVRRFASSQVSHQSSACATSCIPQSLLQINLHPKHVVVAEVCTLDLMWAKG